MALAMSSLMTAFCLRVHQSATCERPAPRKCASSTESERLLGGKKREQVLYPALLERASEMIHRRLGKIGTQDRRQDVHRNVILDKVVLRQTLQTCGTCKALCEKESDCGGKSFPLLCLPLVDVLQEGRKRGLLERLLEVFVSPDKFIEDLDKLLYVFGFRRQLDLEEREGRRGTICVEVGAARLEKPPNDEDVEEGI